MSKPHRCITLICFEVVPQQRVRKMANLIRVQINAASRMFVVVVRSGAAAAAQIICECETYTLILICVGFSIFGSCICSCRRRANVVKIIVLLPYRFRCLMSLFFSKLIEMYRRPMPATTRVIACMQKSHNAFYGRRYTNHSSSSTRARAHSHT